MDQNNNSNFLDKNTLLAIGLSILFFMGWQWYVQKKYPQTLTKQTVQKVESKEKTETIQSQDATVKLNQEKTNVEQPKLTEFSVDNIILKGSLSSAGMGFSNVILKKYSDREGQDIQFSNNGYLIGNFGTQYKGKPVNFNITKKDENTFVGVAHIDGMTIEKTLSVNPSNYTIDMGLKVTGADQQSQLETLILNKALEVESSFLTPAYEGTEFFVINDGSEERERISVKDPMADSYEKVTLASIGSQYFTVALKDRSDIIPTAKVEYSPKTKYAKTSIFHSVKAGQETQILFTGFVGPKKYDIFKKLGPEYVQMINYGIFSVLSKPMLSMLKWLFNLFHNWGLAIILLTIFIRLILLPINISSLKSMKKMQKIQPQLKAIKEKYKDDPVRVNQETMALMKKEKANPIGGCLPMLLQLPVFFALYSVLGQSVELYKSPFIFWIQDLSYKDPFFILPIAVGGLYFIQMSITPQPTDPTQAKMMKFIPLMFCFFMITVPSGLTLYFFVNTVFGIGQQLIFQREKRKAAA